MRQESSNDSSIDKSELTNKAARKEDQLVEESEQVLVENLSANSESKKRHKCNYCSKTIKRLDHFRLHVNAHLARKKRKQSNPHRHNDSDDEDIVKEADSADSDEPKANTQRGRPILKVNLFANSAKLKNLKAKSLEKSPRHLEEYPNIKIVKIDLESESEFDEPLDLKYVLLKDALYLSSDI